MKEEGDTEASVCFGRAGIGAARRSKIKRVVSYLTVTESEPLSRCQEKNTGAHIKRALTLLPLLSV